MNKYREEFEEKHGIQLRGADETTIIYYASCLESKLEQAEKSRNHFTDRYKYMCKREKELEGEIQKQKLQLEQAEKDRETIFKEELEEKLPNVREQADKYQQSTANKMGIERRAFEAGAKWLIQYLKK